MFHASNTQESFANFAYQGSALDFLVISQTEQAILDCIPGWTGQNNTYKNEGYSCALEFKKNCELQQKSTNETRLKGISVSKESNVPNNLKRFSSSEQDLLASTTDQPTYPIRKLKSFSDTSKSHHEHSKHIQSLKSDLAIIPNANLKSRSTSLINVKSNNECRNEECFEVNHVTSSEQSYITEKGQKKSKVPENTHEDHTSPSCKKRKINNHVLEVVSTSDGQIMNGTKNIFGNNHSAHQNCTVIDTACSQLLCEKNHQSSQAQRNLNNVNNQTTHKLQMRKQTNIEISQNKNVPKENWSINVNGTNYSTTFQSETKLSNEFHENHTAAEKIHVNEIADFQANHSYKAHLSSHPSSSHMQYGPVSATYTVAHNNSQNVQEIENSVYIVGEETQKACLGIISNEFLPPTMTSQTVQGGYFHPSSKDCLNSNEKRTNPVVIHVSPASRQTNKGQVAEDSEALPCSSELFDTSLQFSCDFLPAKRKLIFTQEPSGVIPSTSANHGVPHEISQQTRSIFRFTSDQIKKMTNAIYKLYS